VRWCKLAAEQGKVEAQSSLGDFYLNGSGGLTPNNKEAARWYRKAADQGSPIAQCKLGRLYFEGLGVAESDAESKRWVKKAADQGNSEAQHLMQVLSWC